MICFKPIIWIVNEFTSHATHFYALIANKLLRNGEQYKPMSNESQACLNISTDEKFFSFGPDLFSSPSLVDSLWNSLHSPLFSRVSCVHLLSLSVHKLVQLIQQTVPHLLQHGT